MNAALEWQARSLKWRSREMEAACPFEGLVMHYAVTFLIRLISDSIELSFQFLARRIRDQTSHMHAAVNINIKNALQVAASSPNAVGLKSEVAIESPNASKIERGLNHA